MTPQCAEKMDVLLTEKATVKSSTAFQALDIFIIFLTELTTHMPNTIIVFLILRDIIFHPIILFNQGPILIEMQFTLLNGFL